MSAKRGKRKNPVFAAIILLLIISTLVFSALNNPSNKDKAEGAANDKSDNIAVHFLDVGQGDSTFIEFPDGRCMLIDTGLSEYSQTVIDSVEEYGYSKLDYVVATHPHADHIGGMSRVISHFDIGEIYMPKASTTTKTFEKLLTAIDDKGMKINTAKAGVQVYSDSSLNIEFLAPVYESYEKLNNYSAVLKITYGENSFLFTGDAENLSEDEMLANRYDALDCDVLKVAHHGSRYSSDTEFLNAVTPDYAVISCGNDNSYGHPHKEAVDRLNHCGARLYSTAENGTVTVYCDGNDSFEIMCANE